MTAEERERQGLELYPVSPSASLLAAWESGKVPRWREIPNLIGYVSSGQGIDDWYFDETQSAALRGFKLEIHRRLTVGEARHLIGMATKLVGKLWLNF